MGVDHCRHLGQQCGAYGAVVSERPLTEKDLGFSF